MEMLGPNDPVFVIDLTPRTMAVCRGDFEGPEKSREAHPPAVLPQAAEASQPIRAVALVFAWEDDPVLLSIKPTTDTEMLDAMARVIRTAMLTRRSVATVVTEYGDDQLKRSFFAKSLPRFVYEGFPATVRHRIPLELQHVLGRWSGRNKH